MCGLTLLTTTSSPVEDSITRRFLPGISLVGLKKLPEICRNGHLLWELGRKLGYWILCRWSLSDVSLFRKVLYESVQKNTLDISITLPLLNAQIVLYFCKVLLCFVPDLSFYFLFSLSGVRLSPLGIMATIWPIVKAPDGEWWVWSSRRNENWQRKLKHSEETWTNAIFMPQCHMTWARIEPGQQRWKAGEYLPQLCLLAN
jgi:hypothetical protein